MLPCGRGAPEGSRFPAPRPLAAAREHGSRLGAVGEAFRAAPRLRPFLIGLLLVSAAAWGAGSFVPLRIARGGQGEFLVGIAASVAALIEIPIMRASGWLGEHLGMRRLYLTGCAVYVAMLIGWATLSSPIAAAVIRMVSGLSFGLTYVAMVVITARLVPHRVRNTGQALMQARQPRQKYISSAKLLVSSSRPSAMARMSEIRPRGLWRSTLVAA